MSIGNRESVSYNIRCVNRSNYLFLEKQKTRKKNLGGHTKPKYMFETEHAYRLSKVPEKRKV